MIAIKMINYKMFSWFAVMSLLAFCVGRSEKIPPHAIDVQRDSIIGVYLDTSLHGKHINVSYYADKSILIKYKFNNDTSSLSLSKYILPHWFNPNGYKVRPNFIVFDRADPVLMESSFVMLNDSSFAFPIFDIEDLFDLCFIKIINNKLKIRYDSLLLPFKSIKSGPYFMVLYNSTSSEFALSEFFPVRQSGTSFEVVKLNKALPFERKNYYVENNACPYSVWETTQQRSLYLACIKEKIFITK